MNVGLKFLRMWVCSALVVCLIGARIADAQGAPEININSPAIVSLIKSMANRVMQLKPHLEAGVIGLTHDGLVAFRDSTNIEVKALLALDALVGEENKDRATLYREIARANSHPEWESDLRTTFGRRWINRLPVGWFYRDEKGQWIKKAEL